MIEHIPSNRLAVNVGDTLQIGGPSANLLKVLKRARGGWVVQPHGSDTTELVTDLDLVVAYHGKDLQRWACDLEGLDERISAKLKSVFEAWPPHCQRECLRRLAFVQAVDSVRDCHRTLDAAATAVVPDVWGRMSSEWQDREREAASEAAARVRRREAAESDAEPPRIKVLSEPKPSTVVTWHSVWVASGRNELALMPEYGRRGHRAARFPVATTDDEKDTYQLMEEAAKGAYLDLIARSKQVAYEFYRKLCIASGVPFAASRTFRRFLNKRYDDYDRCAKREGKKAAWLRFGIFVLRDLPDRPLEEVEVDHCLVDLIIVDANGRPIGRPWITVFLDRATKCIVGLHVSFLPPSYMTVQRALAHTMYEKDLSAFPGLKNAWLCFGLPEWLISDRGKEFLSRSFRTACLLLHVYPIALPGRKPWLKAAVERIFRTFHARVFDLQEGTTKAWNPDVYNSAKRARLSRSEFDRLIVEWIVDDYHQTPHPALLRKYGREMAPQEAWTMLVDRYGVRWAPDPDHAFRITGEIFKRKILSTGIHIKRQIYVDEPLLARLLRRTGAKDREWTFRRDRADLGRIWILVEGEGWQEIRNLDFAFTDGVSEQQYAIWRGDAVGHLGPGDDPSIDELVDARARVEAARTKALEGGTTLTTALKWARYGDMGDTFTPVPGFGSPERLLAPPPQALLPAPQAVASPVDDEVAEDDEHDVDAHSDPRIASDAALLAEIDDEAMRLIKEMDS